MQTRNDPSPVPKMHSSIDTDWVVTTSAREEAEKNIQETRRLEPAEAFALTILGATFGVPLGAMGAGMAFAVRHVLQKPAEAVKAVKAVKPVLDPIAEACLEPISEPITVQANCLQFFKSTKTAETFLKVVGHAGISTIELVMPEAGENLSTNTSAAEVASRSVVDELRDDLARNWSWPFFIIIIILLVALLVSVGLDAWAMKSSGSDAGAAAKGDTVAEGNAMVQEDAAAEEAAPAKAKRSL